MNTTKQTGNFAENLVAEHLKTQGYKIVCQNWKTPYAEIDVVARRGDLICFVEVKYRRTVSAGDGFDYITAGKLKHMQRAADAYVQAEKWSGEYILMAASIVGELDSPEIEIVEV